MALGIYARKGSRQGVIELDPVEPARVASALVWHFKRCGGDGSGKLVVPAPSGVKATVRDAATGRKIEVDVALEPGPLRGSFADGYLETGITASGKIKRRMVLRANDTMCVDPLEWKRALRQVLVHEMTHAADPGVPRRVARMFAAKKPQPKASSKRTFCTYVNNPFEITAHLAEVRNEIATSFNAKEPALRRKIISVAFPRPEMLLNRSPVYASIAHCLTPKTKKRFYRMAALVWAKLADGRLV